MWEAERSGRLVFVKSTEYNRVLDQLVRRGTHVFVGEDLSSRVLMANDFSATGNEKERERERERETERESNSNIISCRSV